MLSHLKPLLGYFPIINMLMNNWIHFHSRDEGDLFFVLQCSWVLGRGFLWLQRWSVRFKPLTKKPKSQYLWVKLVGFLLELWTWQIVTRVVNYIGHFVYFDELSLVAYDKIILWVLVEMDMM